MATMSMDDFNVGVTLGTGSFGRVRFAVEKATGTSVAVKMLKKAEVVRLQQIEHMISERAILAALDHPFIVSLRGTFQDELYLYMVLQYICGGEFFTHLRKAGRFENSTAQFYAAQIVLVFEHLHSQDIIYRDLKPENLLLDERGYLKITDFGFAKKVQFKTYTLCGTPEYIAPEVLLNQGHGKGVDWWTLGILCYEMLKGEPPFVDDEPMGIYQQILTGKTTFPRFFERPAKKFIKGVLQTDTTKRLGIKFPGVKLIKEHKFFTGTNGVNWDALYAKDDAALGERGPPIIPEVKNQQDTSNFDPYPESTELPPAPEYSGADPFVNF
jgi:serine/threonine protein kinase